MVAMTSSDSLRYETMKSVVNITSDTLFTDTVFNFSSDEVLNILLESSRTKILLPETEVMLIVVYVVLIASGIVSNMLVSFVVVRQCSNNKRNLGSTRTNARNLYIVNLTVADVALCCICMPFTLVSLIQKRWTLGILLCKLVPVVQGTNIMVSAGTITAIALDRYITIVRSPRSHKNSPRQACLNVAITIATIWLLSFLVTSPLFFYSKVETASLGGIILHEKCIESWPSRVAQTVFTITLSLVQFVIPVIVLSVIHLKISAYLNLHLKPINKPKIKIQSPNETVKDFNMDREAVEEEKRQNSNCSQTSECEENKKLDISTRKRSELLSFRDTSNFSGFSISNNSDKNKPRYCYKNHRRARRELRRNRRTMFMLSCIAVVYAVSWLPMTVFTLLTTLSPNFFENPKTLYTVLAICHVIAMSSAVTNPLLYGWLNTNFRREFTNISSSVSNFFNKILDLHCLCFVCKSSTDNISNDKNHIFINMNGEKKIITDNNTSSTESSVRLRIFRCLAYCKTNHFESNNNKIEEV